MAASGSKSTPLALLLRQRLRALLGVFAVLAVMLLSTGTSAAHKVSAVSLVLDLRSSGEARVELNFNLTQQQEDGIGPSEAAERFLRDQLRFQIDGAAAVFSETETHAVEGAEAGQGQANATIVLRTLAEPGQHAWVVELGQDAPAFLAVAIVRDGVTERRARVLIPGEDSGEIHWSVEPATGAATNARAGTGPRMEARAESEPSGWRTVLSCLKIGFEHILPLGMDHILFVLGLFFAHRGWKSLLGLVTAFTVAHSLTLALASFDIVRISPSIVEPLIALSIVWVAVENLLRKPLEKDAGSWTRLAVVFALGLVHGLGFAGILRELGLSGGQLAAGLVSFNAGVELGQLAVIALAFLVSAPVREKEWYARAVVTPACLAIAAVGLFWTVERIG